tara:strand:+ start:798 stop:1088 length:291 start_codon:yes stop_codon:yes gene_type:complete
MKEPYKTKWVEALRSGEFKQTRERLKKSNQHGSSFCCLGVLRELFPETIDGKEGSLTTESLETIDLSKDDESRLIKMNDNMMWSFVQISNYIEKYL